MTYDLRLYKHREVGFRNVLGVADQQLRIEANNDDEAVEKARFAIAGYEHIDRFLLIGEDKRTLGPLRV